MDVSLAYPLYFAARGVGSLVAVDGPRARYRATARVYLSGLGADE
jgi:asparagine synthetase B (glutamine-hydrolysing)